MVIAATLARGGGGLVGALCYGFSSFLTILVTLTTFTFPSTVQPVHLFYLFLVQLRTARRSHAYSLAFPISSQLCSSSFFVRIASWSVHIFF